MRPRNGFGWTIAGLLVLGLLAGTGEPAAAGEKKKNKKKKSAQSSQQAPAAAAQAGGEQGGAEKDAKEKKKGGKKKGGGKKDEGEQGEGKQPGRSETGGGAPAAPAAEEARVVRDVDKRLVAYDTGGARRLLASEPVSSNVHLMVAEGRILEQEKKYGEAAARLREAASMAPEDPEPLIHLGQSQLHAGDMAAAEEAFWQAERRAEARLEASPGSAEALYHLGVARQRLKRYDEAAAALEKARSAAPSDAMPVFQLGVTRAFQGDWQAALDRLTEAIEMNPGIAYAYYYRGLAANELGRKDLLVNDLDRFVTMAPEAPEATQAKRLLQGL